MKRKILQWLINKLEKTNVTYTEIGQHLRFDWSKNVPRNNDWHHVALTFEAWIKVNPEGEIEKYDMVKTYIDGKNDKQFYFDDNLIK